MNTKSNDAVVAPPNTSSAKELLKRIRAGVLAEYQTRGKLR